MKQTNKKPLKKNNSSKKTFDKFLSLPLWDRCILLIMAILLLEAMFVLLFDPATTAIDTTIDTGVSATATAIFGYFLSQNFLNNQNSRTQKTSYPSAFEQIKEQQPAIKIMPDDQEEQGKTEPFMPILDKTEPEGASAPIQQSQDKSPEAPAPIQQTEYKDHSLASTQISPPVYSYEHDFQDHHWIMRIKIITAISVFSLLILLLIRNFGTVTSDSEGFITLFKNFASGSVGYLIGYVPGIKTDS